MIRSRRLASVLAVALLLLVPALALAQSQATTGVIEGTVSDPTGAPIPGATVVVKNTATNLERTLATDADGRFRALLLPLGPYRVTVSLGGLRDARARGHRADRRPVGQPRAHAQGLERPGGDRGPGRLARDRDDARRGLDAHQPGRDQGPAQQRPQLPRLHEAHARRQHRAGPRRRRAHDQRPEGHLQQRLGGRRRLQQPVLRRAARRPAARLHLQPRRGAGGGGGGRRAPTPSSAARTAASSTW